MRRAAIRSVSVAKLVTCRVLAECSAACSLLRKASLPARSGPGRYLVAGLGLREAPRLRRFAQCRHYAKRPESHAGCRLARYSAKARKRHPDAPFRLPLTRFYITPRRSCKLPAGLYLPMPAGPELHPAGGMENPLAVRPAEVCPAAPASDRQKAKAPGLQRRRPAPRRAALSAGSSPAKSDTAKSAGLPQRHSPAPPGKRGTPGSSRLTLRDHRSLVE
jgi:hypothetical protein